MDIINMDFLNIKVEILKNLICQYRIMLVDRLNQFLLVVDIHVKLKMVSKTVLVTMIKVSVRNIRNRI